MKLQPEYLWQSRTGIYFFRARIPKQFREHFKACEIKKSLKTDSQRLAAKLARAYRVELDQEMEKLTSGVCLDDSQQNTPAKPKTNQTATKPKSTQRIELITRIDLSGNKIIFDYNDPQKDGEALAAYENNLNVTPQAKATPAPKPKKSKAPKLSVVRLAMLASLDKTQADLHKKTSSTKLWDSFCEIVGDKPIDELTQDDITDYLLDISFLPSGTSETNYKKILGSLSCKEKIKITKLNKYETISAKTFTTNYKAPITKLIEFGRLNYRDQGFGELSTINCKFEGDQEKGQHEQRNLSLDEVETLVNNDLMKKYIKNLNTVHHYWFTMTGLFTGMRLNEVCQLHPTNDIKQGENGVWFFEVTDDEDNKSTEPKIVNQSAKTEASKRCVPIHQKLIDMGILQYVEQRRSQNAVTIFPYALAHNSKSGTVKAGKNAGIWFSKYLNAIGLRDETPENKIVGYHCLRKTFITECGECGMKDFSEEFEESQRFLSALGRIAPIVGHETGVKNRAGENVVMTAFYSKRRLKELKKGDMIKRKAIVDKLDYGIGFIQPQIL